MKRIIMLFGVVIMLLGLVACGNDYSTNIPTNPAINNGNDGAPQHILEQAAAYATAINSDTVPDADYWTDALVFLIYDVNRENWGEVLQCMEWGDDVLNTLNPSDANTYSSRYFTFEDGVFTIYNHEEWHDLALGYNVDYNEIDNNLIVKPHDPNNPSYILMQAPGYGFYIVEISESYPSNLTTLSQPGHNEYYIKGPWLKDLLYTISSSLNNYATQANELFYEMDWENDQSSQERWNEPMQFVTEHIPQSDWHAFFSHSPFFGEQVLPYSSYYEYTGINVINASEPNDYDTGAALWNFEDGKFILYSGSHHYVKWSKNISWDNDPEDYNSTRTGTLINEDEPGVIWLLFCDYYYHMVVIDPNNPTQLTNLSEFFPDEFSILFWGPSGASIIIVDENGDYIDLFTGEIVSGEE